MAVGRKPRWRSSLDRDENFSSAFHFSRLELLFQITKCNHYDAVDLCQTPPLILLFLSSQDVCLIPR